LMQMQRVTLCTAKRLLPHLIISRLSKTKRGEIDVAHTNAHRCGVQRFDTVKHLLIQFYV